MVAQLIRKGTRYEKIMQKNDNFIVDDVICNDLHI